MEYPGWGTPNPSTPFTPRGWGGDVDTPPKSPMLHYEEARLRDTGEREREGGGGDTRPADELWRGVPDPVSLSTVVTS